jgi:hypothetical protein
VVPFSRPAYLPRTPGPRDLRSYSGRRSSELCWLAFFIDAALTACGGPGRDWPNGLRTICVRHHKNTPALPDADGDEAELVNGVVWISEGDRQRVLENGNRFGEGDPMLLGVRGGLLVVPFNDQEVSARVAPRGLANTRISGEAPFEPGLVHCMRLLGGSPYFVSPSCFMKS